MGFNHAYSISPLQGFSGNFFTIQKKITLALYIEKTLINVSLTTCFSLVSLCEQFIQLYIVDYHVVERALKERYLIGQPARAVI